ncbi:hypothetical protein N7532_006065 [Penicillium argentinense]|uniref:Uncharacterized protein n=1 Tax=Penicillium argentinense TaxID=1131581 RepID=A0A9W9FFC9_9EURO|nr:uncharacterized protein N7532_006065 [Penicillium argentinense]KAJ5099064.1 hypothetical protein N7532_006065 [Penicillium argentinense]
MAPKGASKHAPAKTNPPPNTTAKDSDSPPTCESFSPAKMSLDTYKRLLSCYPTTVKTVQRLSALRDLQPEKVVKDKPSPLKKTFFSAEEEDQVREKVNAFLELDEWRYEEFPQTIASRKQESSTDLHLTKEEVLKVVEWKLKHGVNRPWLLGQVRNKNTSQAIEKTTKEALAALPTDPTAEKENLLPIESLGILNDLHAIGPATSSLLLSLATKSSPPPLQVPFFSDPLFAWLVGNDFPETYASAVTAGNVVSGWTAGRRAAECVDSPQKGPTTGSNQGIFTLGPSKEVKCRYTTKEYVSLWREATSFRDRLSAEGGEITMTDLEKVGYVLANIAVSGFYEGFDAWGILEMSDKQRAVALGRIVGGSSGGWIAGG